MFRANAGGSNTEKRLQGIAKGVLLMAICAGAQAGWTAEPAMKKTVAAELPAPGTYKIDPDHSFAFFSAWHHFVGRVRGRFEKVTGTIVVSPDPAACSVDVTIDAATISTQVKERDEDLMSDVYFDAKKFLTMTYRGRGIHRVSAGMWRMDGALTLHGVTRVVPLTFRFNGVIPGTKPTEPVRVAFHGTAATKRELYGIGARDNADEVGNRPEPDVDIEIDVEADGAVPHGQ